MFVNTQNQRIFLDLYKILVRIRKKKFEERKKKKSPFPSSRNVSTKIYTNGPAPVDKNRAVKVEAERGNISRRGGTWYESPPPSCITEIARKILATRRSKIGGGGKKEKEKRKRKEKKGRGMPRNCAKFCRSSIVFPVRTKSKDLRRDRPTPIHHSSPLHQCLSLLRGSFTIPCK